MCRSILWRINVCLEVCVCVCVSLCLPPKCQWYRTNCQNKSCSIQNRLRCQGHIFLPPISWQTLSQQLSVVFSVAVSLMLPPPKLLAIWKLGESGHFLCGGRRSVLLQSTKLFSERLSLLGTLKTFLSGGIGSRCSVFVFKSERTWIMWDYFQNSFFSFFDTP